jgi:hypothetical protein
MRGQPQARTARLFPRSPDRSGPSWITLAIRRRRRVSQERLEVIERLSSERRRARRAGEYVPDPGRQPRRWV